MIRARLRRSLDLHTASFVFGSVVIVAACLAVSRTGLMARAPELGYFGITFDLCITLPLLYYFVMVRSGHAAPVTMIPLFVITLLLARAVVPPQYRMFLDQLRLAQIPAVAVVMTVLAIRLRTAARASAGEKDVIRRIERIVQDVLGGSRVSRIVSFEIGALYLGIFGWRIPDPNSRGIASTTFHRRSGWGSVVACVVVLIAAEAVGVHLFVQQWSPIAAWVISGLDLWGMVWLLGDYQAFRTRPLVVTEDALELRFGFRWGATVPLSMIASVEPLSADRAEQLRRSRSSLRMAILDDPEYLVQFTEPVRISGAAGMSREVTSVGLRVDDGSVIEALVRTATRS